jgi:hypothetical protein
MRLVINHCPQIPQIPQIPRIRSKNSAVHSPLVEALTPNLCNLRNLRIQI